MIVFCSELSEDESLKAKFHYREAKVDGILYKLEDNAYVKVSVLFYLMFINLCFWFLVEILVF